MSAALRFAANLKWMFTELPFESRFDAAAAAGFTGVEYASPYEYEPAVLRRRLSDAGLSQVLINTPVDTGPGSHHRAGCAGVPGAQAAFRDGLRQAVHYANELNCPLVHVMAGVRPVGVSRTDAFGAYVENLSWAAEYVAGNADLRLVLEAMNHVDRPGYLVESQEEAAAAVDAVDSRRLGVLFDVYHCARSQGRVVDRLRSLIQWTAHVQVAEPPHRGEPGTGDLVDWPLLFRELLASGYDGWVGCEYQPVTTTDAGLGWLRTLVPA